MLQIKSSLEGHDLIVYRIDEDDLTGNALPSREERERRQSSIASRVADQLEKFTVVSRCEVARESNRSVSVFSVVIANEDLRASYELKLACHIARSLGRLEFRHTSGPRSRIHRVRWQRKTHGFWPERRWIDQTPELQVVNAAEHLPTPQRTTAA